MLRLLVLCTHNSARSQMAEGWLRQLLSRAGIEAEVCSAGTEKTLVKPDAIQAMAECGIDLSRHHSKTLQEVPALDRFDAVLTVCDSANDQCPIFPSPTRRYHLGLPDPSGGDADRWRQSRDQIGRVMKALVDSLGQGRWPEVSELEAQVRRYRPIR